MNKIVAIFVVLLKLGIDIQQIWSISDDTFNALALQIFRFQAKNNAVYAEYLRLIDKTPEKIEQVSEIPFLPISFFKNKQVKTGSFTPSATFESSSTTGLNTSKHFVKNIDVYHQNTLRILEKKLGPISGYRIMGLLPNYLERKNSSLVSMVKFLMDHNSQTDDFYLYEYEQLHTDIQTSTQPILLFGVSFALLDFAESYPLADTPLTIIETGGMKGRKKEMTKEAVYSELQSAFPHAKIRSEYGMTELLSQAYSDELAVYTPPPWMKVLPRPDNDPLGTAEYGKNAALNIIDLCNLDSCCFIATDDIGRVAKNGEFTVSGRLDYADLRGCSLMVV